MDRSARTASRTLAPASERVTCEWCGGWTPSGPTCAACGSPLSAICRYCGDASPQSPCPACQECLQLMSDLAAGRAGKRMIDLAGSD